MSFSHLLSDPARSVHYPLSSRASSATLLLPHGVPYCHTDGGADPIDMSIAQGLLQPESPRIPRRRSSFSHSATAQNFRSAIDNEDQLTNFRPSRNRYWRQDISSNTWTSSSGDGSEEDGNDDRTPFVNEYNRLSKKYGVQAIVSDEFIAVHEVDKLMITSKADRWSLRKFLGRTSSVKTFKRKAEKDLRYRRSVSNLSLRIRPNKDALVGKDLAELIRLCGASPLYLPAEYAASTLAVPTCFRATAQYLVQHAATSRGIFRIPGAHSTINALYNHYACQNEEGGMINGTVRCPTLPEHIQYGVHDVASAFKKFLAGLPGGILGKAWLFNAFISIYTQLDAEAELMRTKQSKVRARLIALAIATIAPRYQRDLICAVLGLLSMIGRAAETAPREDVQGRPLPTSDLMGYEALGIVFGPLLVGNLVESHDLCPTGPHGSLMLIQLNPSESSKGKHKKIRTVGDSITLLQGTDKIRVINTITEMLITHWRDVVRHMKNSGALKTIIQHDYVTGANTGWLAPPLLPGPFAIRRPRDWDEDKSSVPHVDRSRSPTPSSRNGQINNLRGSRGDSSNLQVDILPIRKRRPRPMSSQILSGAKSMSVLAPTVEETSIEEKHGKFVPDIDLKVTQSAGHLHDKNSRIASQSSQACHTAHLEHVGKPSLKQPIDETIEAASQSTKQDVVSTESNSQNAKNAIEVCQIVSKHDHGMLKDHYYSAENTRMDVAEVQPQFSNQIRVSPFHDTQSQSEELSEQLIATSPNSRSSKYVQNLQKAFSQVPTGIVSSRLRGIRASDPGFDIPSGFAGISKTHYGGASTQKRRPNTTTGGSRTFEHFPEDPLSKVTREEDIASLESLAEVIQSQDESVNIRCLSNLNLMTCPSSPVDVFKSRKRSTVSVTTIPEPYSIEALTNTSKEVDMQEILAFVTKTAPPANTGTLPITPRRSATELSILHQSGRSSVRALASRFGNAAENVRHTSSPTHTPDSRVSQGSLAEKAVVALYTVNTSPVPMTQKVTNSGTSLESICNPMQGKTSTVVSSSRVRNTAYPLLPKPLFSSSYLQEDSGSLSWPNPHPMNGSPRLNNDIVQVGCNSVTLPPFSSNLRRTGDGYVSFALSRRPSLAKILPRPDELPVAEYMDFARPAAMYTDHHSSLFDFSTSSPIEKTSSPSSSVGNQRTKNHNASILYMQIQYLSKQLRAKADEADQLRRQLVTKDSLKDLGTLIQQLSQAKKDLALWRGRAEAAEKRLNVLSRISQKEVDEAVGEMLVTGHLETIERSFTDKDARSKSRITKEIHSFDGICLERTLSGCEGIIGRTSLEQ